MTSSIHQEAGKDDNGKEKKTLLVSLMIPTGDIELNP